MEQPFFWQERDGWYLNQRSASGKRSRVRLADTKKAAFEKWRAMLARQKVLENDPLMLEVLDQWIDRQRQRLERGEISQDRFERVASIIRVWLASEDNQKLTVSQLTPAKFQAWCHGRKIKANTEATELAILKSALRWAEDDALLCVRPPLLRAKPPSTTRRETFIDRETHRKFVELCGANRFCGRNVRCFRTLLIACFHTGCRPGELRTLRWNQIDPEFTRAIQPHHKTKRKTKKPRIIYFSPCMQTLLRMLPRESEFVFVNARGEPWSNNAVVHRMARLRLKSNSDATAYSYRHGYVTRAIVAGVDPATVAELAGHSSVEMIAKVYGHLDQAVDHLKEATQKIAKANNKVSTN